MLAASPLWALAYVTPQEMAKNPERASGLFRVYPDFNLPKLTPAPKGYTPFYISHYGRHGSRWLGSEAQYIRILAPLLKADSLGNLTPKGKEVLCIAQAAYAQADGLSGALAPAGTAQHQGIASRMIANYPEVFKGDAKIDARSTVVVRCVVSMNAFCERLKETNPKLKIDYEASIRSTRPLEYVYPAAHNLDKEYLEFDKNGEYSNTVNTLLTSKLGTTFTETLFKKDPFKKEEKRNEFILTLFWLACDLPNVMPEESLWSAFTPEMLRDLALIENFRNYVKRGPHPEGRKWNMTYAKRLLNDINDRACDAVNGNGRAADLRFGHDINLMGLFSLMDIDGTGKVETDPEKVPDTFDIYKLTPMAANMQMIFFRNDKKDVLVKLLVNEREASLPIPSPKEGFYKWTDLHDYINSRLTHDFTILEK